MSDERTRMLALIIQATESGVLRKLVLSKPAADAPAPKQNGKLCLLRGERALVLESAFEGGRVAQKIYTAKTIAEELPPVLAAYGQINLLTSAGEAELRTSKKGKATLLGDKALSARMAGGGELLRFDMPIDREKRHILTGNEPFLTALGITGKDGRIHDKRQAKFRQINRFLEQVEDVYSALPKDGILTVYDLCCGKSYLSFALYHYLTAIRSRAVNMICVDLKQDVMDDCAAIAREAGFVGMSFICGDVRRAVPPGTPDLVISLHACDIATDIVLDTAMRLDAGIILSTPCCHKYLNGKVVAEELKFVTDYPHIANKLCEAITDALRLARLKAGGYNVSAIELTDPENTPKNTLIKAVKSAKMSEKERQKYKNEYRSMLSFVLGEGADKYLSEIR